METSHRAKEENKKNQLFILPIRDGNSLNLHIKYHETKPFYTSYKGWKRRNVSRLQIFALSFYTSYKGWKLSPLKFPTRYHTPFYTSYKGWKPGFCFFKNFSSIDFLYFL